MKSLLLFSALGIVAILAWLGAILSQSLLAVELATSATNLLLLLSIALAIWHPQVAARRFWTGFCILGLGSVVLGTYFSAYANVSTELAKLIAGDVAYGGVVMGYGYSGGGLDYYSNIYAGWPSPRAFLCPSSNGVTQIPQVPQTATVSAPAATSWQLYQCVLTSVSPILSLLVAYAGGWLTFLISRPMRTERAP